MADTDAGKSAGAPRIAIVGFAHDENSSFLRGPAQAPPLIRQVLFSDSSNMWSESGLDLGKESTFLDAGDHDPGSAEAAASFIESIVSDLLSRNLSPISLGGDHSITFPIIRAFARKFTRLNILHFDAHPDLYHDFDGNPFSHASPFARIMEEGLAARLVQVGIRTLNGHQREQASRFGVEIVEMKDWRDELTFDFEGPVYITIDMDSLDPAFAPGVSHYEPGGLSTRQVVGLIQRITGRVIGADIVEYNPTRDIHNMTAMVCAKFLKELAAKMLISPLQCLGPSD